MIGTRIGNYVISQKLGEGGMGEVYLAQHPQIGKRVALKVLHTELASREDIVSRFFHEAKAVNDIGHPNIVDILDFGSQQTERGTIVYLVMELLDGTNLKDVVQQGPLEPMRALQIVHQVGEALVASHERGIVHRDLKPENIMLIGRGREQDFVKLLDFGIAKMTQGGMSKTRTGMVMGTPVYMSPEQCEGRSDIDHRTDVYALGIVLFELLTGRTPFEGDSYTQLLLKQITEPPPSLLTLRPTISRQMDAIVLKALQKRREDRFESMRAMLDALRNPAGFVDVGPAPIRSSSDAVTVPSGERRPVNTATTLSRSVGEIHGTQVMPSRSKLPLFAGIGALLIGGGIVAIVATRGKAHATAETSASEQPAETTAPATTAAAPTPPTPAPAPPTPVAEPAPVKPAEPPAPAKPAEPPTPAKPAEAAAATVAFDIASKPAGAAVYFRDERAARCKTPCRITVPADTAAPTITLKAAGFAVTTRKLDLHGTTALFIDLPAAQTTTTAAKQPPKDTSKASKDSKDSKQPRPVGDNTLNPFDD